MRRFVTLLAPLLAGNPAAALAQTLTLHYQERPPYSSTQADGQVIGLVAAPAAAALERAGIAFRWALTPSQRQLALIQSGRGQHCGVGWFRTDERADKGQFSAALYRDHPLAALVRSDAALPAGASAAALLQAGHLRLLVKDGYSYGPALDRLIAAQTVAPQRTSVDPPQMAQMLRSGRADWMIVAPEEAAVLGGTGLRLHTLADAPQGSTRHLYCSTDVPTDWLARIDRALPALP
jgi:polar amino acid transport system substrate-binding protein